MCTVGHPLNMCVTFQIDAIAGNYFFILFFLAATEKDSSEKNNKEPGKLN